MDRAVEVTHEAVGITLLFDTFSGESKNLLESFKNAGAAFHAAVIEDDGFLPDDVMSVYGFFLGDYREADSLPGKPLYFNQIQIPDYWRIEGDNSSAKVMDRTRERARIFFTEPTHRRQVKIVDWLDDAGQVRLSEHYNRYGAIFCHTVFNKKGQKALRKFFDVTGREMIVETSSPVIYSSDGRIRTGFSEARQTYSVFHQVLRAGGYSGLFQLAVISVFCITGACAKRLSRRTFLARAGGR